MLNDKGRDKEKLLRKALQRRLNALKQEKRSANNKN